jgi:hypothetical protein
MNDKQETANVTTICAADWTAELAADVANGLAVVTNGDGREVIDIHQSFEKYLVIVTTGTYYTDDAKFTVTPQQAPQPAAAPVPDAGADVRLELELALEMAMDAADKIEGNRLTKEVLIEHLYSAVKEAEWAREELAALRERVTALAGAVEPFQIAGKTMGIKFPNATDSDIIYLYFAKDGRYIYPIYVEDFRNVDKALASDATASADSGGAVS